MKTSKLCAAFFLALTLAFSLTSCAPLVNGTRQNIKVSRKPVKDPLYLQVGYAILEDLYDEQTKGIR